MAVVVRLNKMKEYTENCVGAVRYQLAQHWELEILWMIDDGTSGVPTSEIFEGITEMRLLWTTKCPLRKYWKLLSRCQH